MSKFYGPIGFAESREIEEGSGIWDDIVIERYYRGDISKMSKQWVHGENLNSDLEIKNTISILADPYISENLFRIRYIKILGGYWNITSVEVQYPRLVLTIGGVYNGPTAETSANFDEHPRFK